MVQSSSFKLHLHFGFGVKYFKLQAKALIAGGSQAQPSGPVASRRVQVGLGCSASPALPIAQSREMLGEPVLPCWVGMWCLQEVETTQKSGVE